MTNIMPQRATANPLAPPETPSPDYTPVFNNMTRAVVYVVCLVASVVGLGFMSFGHPDIGGFMSTAAGIVAAGFGVAYNPVRLARK